MSEGVSRIALTPAAARLIRLLRAKHGPLMFHQSGGCCDGSSPMCYPRGEFRTGGSDVLLAELAVDGVEEPVGFWMSAEQFERWRHTHLTVDVVPGRGSGFSLEAPEGVRFLIRSRLLTDREARVLDNREARVPGNRGTPVPDDRQARVPDGRDAHRVQAQGRRREAYDAASARESVCRRSGGPGRA